MSHSPTERYEKGCFTSHDRSFIFHCNKVRKADWGSPGKWRCDCGKWELNGHCPSRCEWLKYDAGFDGELVTVMLAR